eukprot:452202-Alexandrium_andersonii.AAC.1
MLAVCRARQVMTGPRSHELQDKAGLCALAYASVASGSRSCDHTPAWDRVCSASKRLLHF